MVSVAGIVGEKNPENSSVSAADRTVLNRLNRPDAYGIAAIEGGDVVIVGKTGSVSLAASRIAALVVARLVRTGLLFWERDGGSPRLLLTPRGRAVAEGGDGATIVTLTMDVAGQSQPVSVNAAESPLAWLARRKDGKGQPLLSPECFAAGERLRADFTRASMGPRMSADWSGAPRSGASFGSSPMAEATLAARQRVRRALDAAGKDVADLLLDACCFLTRLEDIEHARGWPARSGKVVLGLALSRLADHYGLVARGPNRATIRTWSADETEKEDA